MITVITGLTGSGKTYFMSRLALKERKRGEQIHANLSFIFPNNNEGVYRWHNLTETFNITQGTICIDEGQKLFDARMWKSLPMTFVEKIASHRHQGLNILTTTQDFGHIDVRIRENVHELYNCQSIVRFPRNERLRPLIQVSRVTKFERSFTDNNRVKWVVKRKKLIWISKLWTKEIYNTYANIDLSHFICYIKRDKKKWQIVLQSRQLGGRKTLTR